MTNYWLRLLSVTLHSNYYYMNPPFFSPWSLERQLYLTKMPKCSCSIWFHRKKRPLENTIVQLHPTKLISAKHSGLPIFEPFFSPLHYMRIVVFLKIQYFTTFKKGHVLFGLSFFSFQKSIKIFSNDWQIELCIINRDHPKITSVQISTFFMFTDF